MSPSSLWSLLLVMSVAALAPIVSRLVPGRPPQVLFLILGGVIIGPHALGFADSVDIELLAGLGLGFLFLLAGHELDPKLLREKAGTQALIAWTISAVLAVLVVGGLAALGFVQAFLPVSHRVDHHRPRHPAADPARPEHAGRVVRPLHLRRRRRR